MKRQDYLELLNDLDEDLIEKADHQPKKHRNKRYWILAAAVLCVAIFSVAGTLYFRNSSDHEVHRSVKAEDTNESLRMVDGKEQQTEEPETSAPETEKIQEKTDESTTESTQNHEIIAVNTGTIEEGTQGNNIQSYEKNLYAASAAAADSVQETGHTHTWSLVSSVQPGLHQEGVNRYECSTCGESYEERTAALSGEYHDYADLVIVSDVEEWINVEWNDTPILKRTITCQCPICGYEEVWEVEEE